MCCWMIYPKPPTGCHRYCQHHRMSPMPRTPMGMDRDPYWEDEMEHYDMDYRDDMDYEDQGFRRHHQNRYTCPQIMR